MKNGYYVFAYIEINKYANFYKIDTVRHDQNISLYEYKDGQIKLLRYWELERLSRIKHHNKAFFCEEQVEHLINNLLSEFNITIGDLSGFFAYPYFNQKLEASIDENYNYHSFCHLFSSLLMETKKFYNDNMLAFSVDLDSDYLCDQKSINKNDYIGCYSQKGKLNFFPIESPASLWSVASHDMKMGEGTLMALSSALKTQFKHSFDFSNVSFFKYDLNKTKNIYNDIKKVANKCHLNNVNDMLDYYDKNFSFEDNLKSAIMKVVQETSQQIMKRNVDNAIKLFNLNPNKTILSMSGGFALNCPTNSFLLNNYKFKEFIAPPCINDSGQSLGMALYYFYLNGKNIEFSLNNSFYGKKYSEDYIIKKYSKFIIKIDDFDEKKAAEDIINNVIVWYEGSSEIGPRALGHRSIISAATSLKIKNKINEIKMRQKWRPVAPMVLERYGNDWFDNYISSKYMLLTFNIKESMQKKIKAVSHLDKSARIQTLDDKNEKMFRILEKLNQLIGVPIVCNTSLNDYKEPIIETPEEAIYFAMKKKINIIYLNGKRIELDTNMSLDFDKPEGSLNIWDGNHVIENPVLTRDEYDFYYWSFLEKDFPLKNKKDITIVKRLFKSYFNNNDKINILNFYY